MSNQTNNPQKSDQVALKILNALKAENLVNHFKKLKEDYGTYDAIRKDGNVLYPVSLREGVFLRKFIRDMGEDEWRWKEKLGLAMMYEEHQDKIGNWSSNE
jgi:hypothetical protein